MAIQDDVLGLVRRFQGMASGTFDRLAGMTNQYVAQVRDIALEASSPQQQIEARQRMEQQRQQELGTATYARTKYQEGGRPVEYHIAQETGIERQQQEIERVQSEMPQVEEPAQVTPIGDLVLYHVKRKYGAKRKYNEIEFEAMASGVRGQENEFMNAVNEVVSNSQGSGYPLGLCDETVEYGASLPSGDIRTIFLVRGTEITELSSALQSALEGNGFKFR